MTPEAFEGPIEIQNANFWAHFISCLETLKNDMVSSELDCRRAPCHSVFCMHHKL